MADSGTSSLHVKIEEIHQLIDGVAHRLGIKAPPRDSDVVADENNIYLEKIPKEILKQMLIRENELRLSPEVQAIYAQYNQHPEMGDWINYTYQLQEDLVTEFGYGGSPDRIRWSVNQLRTATAVYPDLAEIPLYVRHNRAKRGELREGDLTPDLVLHQFPNCQTENLLQRKQVGRPLVICAASWT